MTNAERADAALIALDRYDGGGRHPVEKEEIEEAMVDLIANLEHLAKREGVSFVGVLGMAMRHVIEERAGL